MTTKSYDGFSAEERAAMKERAEELKPTRGGKKKDPEAEMMAKIAELSDADRAIAERLHAIVKENAPELTAKTYYGMPGWAKDGKILVFFQPADKFKTRYGTLGFQDNAQLDDGDLWPAAYALPKLTAAGEKKIAALIKKAVG
jgi:uncharacterized protein YdhG (YjbR/CyaY superfamily)